MTVDGLMGKAPRARRRPRECESPPPLYETITPSVRWSLTVCIMMATVMQALDTTIANVALPYMQGSLSTTQDQINWVLTSYIVAAAIMTSPLGWMATRVRTQEAVHRLHRRFHRRLDAVRRGAVDRADGRLPAAAGRVRRGAGAAVAGGDARHLPAQPSAARRWRSGAWA